MEKKKTPKHVIFFIIGYFYTLVGALIGLLIFIFLTMPFLTKLKPFIGLFVVLPLALITAYIFSLLAIVTYLIAWKPFLSLQEVKEYILNSFDERVAGLLDDLIRLDNRKRSKLAKYFLFLSPYYTYYKLVMLIFPKVKEQFK